MDVGGQMRLDILRRDAEQHFLKPLRMHGWAASIERESPSGEFLTVACERSGQKHSIAFLYSSATANSTYKSLAQQSEFIFFNGEPYKLESFAYGLDKPVEPVTEFHTLLSKWNAESADGKFSPVDDTAAHDAARRPKHRVLLSEEPIEAIWLRLRQLQSVTLAKKLVASRAEQDQASLDAGQINSKAEGIAYALRNATDYFNARDVRNVSQRVLNLYYGSLSFAAAEMLALPNGSKALSEIEKSTTQGHGLYAIDGAADGLENLVVGAITSGFFPDWLKTIGITGCEFPDKKPRKYTDVVGLPLNSWLTIESLFASIPEVADLFFDIFESAPRWVTPVYDQLTNMSVHGRAGCKGVTSSYVLLVDDSARLTKEEIALFPGPISEISAVPSEYGRQFRVSINHTGYDMWWKVMKTHHSPFERNALILPIFGVVDEFRVIAVVLLYALSIIVRYRPSLWRRVQDGDLDHMRVLIEAFLAVAERVLPDEFLQKISGQRVSTHQPGSFFS